MKRKNFKQRLISFILVFIMIMGLLPLSVINIMADDNIIIGADFENIEMPKAQANGFIAPIDNNVPDNAIHIQTAEQLASIGGADSEGKYYVLDNDINLVDEWTPIDDFRGTFDGQGHSINNLYVLEESKREYAGLFGEIDYYSNGVTIKNVGVNIGSQGMTSSSYSASSYSYSCAGGLIGLSGSSTTIENCYSTGNATAAAAAASYAGGLIGCSGGTTIENCYSTGSATAASYYSASYYYSSYAGGLIGLSGSSTTIENCYSTGSATATSYYSSYAGGLIGCSSGSATIENCYSTGSATAASSYSASYYYSYSPSYAGGLAGYCNDRTTIKNCYATGNATASSASSDSAYSSYAGGLVGHKSYYAIVTNCYQVLTQTIIGYPIDTSGTPLTLEQMQNKSSYIGFDFDTVWAIDPNINNGYPYLRANPPQSDNSEPSEYTTVVFDETTYTAEVGETIYITVRVKSINLLEVPETTWQCNDLSAVEIKTEQMSTQIYYDFTTDPIVIDYVTVSVPVICKKAGNHTISVKTEDGAFASTNIIITGLEFNNDSIVINWGDNSYSFYYSDSFFSESSYVYNHDLARLSIGMEAASFTATSDDTYQMQGSVGREKNIKEAYAKLGFTHAEFINYDKSLDDCSSKVAFSLATKYINNKKETLIAVVIRGGGYGAEWTDNFNVGVEEFHLGFGTATSEVYHSIIDYIDKLKTDNKINGKVKIWITGYSRAGAVANLTAGWLNVRSNNINPDDIYTYTFATPQGVNTNKATVNHKVFNTNLNKNVNIFDNIFNIINPTDAIPTLALSKWKFNRYGVNLILTSLNVGGTDTVNENLNKKLFEETVINPVKSKYKEITGNNYPINNPLDISGVNQVKKIFGGLAKNAGQYAEKWQNIIMDFISVLTVRQDLISGNHDVLEEYKLRFGQKAFAKLLADGYEDSSMIGELMSIITSISGKDSYTYYLVLVEICIQNGMELDDLEHEILSLGNIIKIYSLFDKFSDVGNQHSIEVYMAWLFAHDTTKLYGKSTAKKISAKCPIDINVYDSEDNLVASIINDVIVIDVLPIEITDNMKEIYLSNDNNYRIETTARDNGTMFYSITEYNLENEEIRKVNFYDIDLIKGLKLVGYVNSYNETPIENYQLIATIGNDTKIIMPNDEIIENELNAIEIDIVVNGRGSVLGSQITSKGNYITVYADALLNSTFTGWYRNGVKVSDNETYGFIALESQVLEAKFEDVLKAQFIINLTAETGGTISGDGVYNENENVTLIAKPNTDYIFNGWYENGAKINGAGEIYTFKATVNRNLEAHFVYSNSDNGKDEYIPPLNENNVDYSNTNNLDTEETDTAIEAINIIEEEMGEETELQENVESINVSEKLASILETDKSIKYIYGYEDGTFKPDNHITRAEVATMFFRLIKDENKNDNIIGNFKDVENGEWYAQAINYLAQIGILKGYENGSFKPNQNITREEFSAIISRFDDIINGVENPFIDVSKDLWAYESIMSAYYKDWIKGYSDNTFKPKNNIIRAEVVTIINRMLDRKATGENPDDLKNPYKDLSINHWAFKDIIVASSEF